MYERSYMHRDTLTHVCVCTHTDFLVTSSADGVVKFWKKYPGGIEFAKTYRAHVGRVVALAASHDGARLASCGVDMCVRVYDVAALDMTDMGRLEWCAAAAEWVSAGASSRAWLAVAERGTPRIHLLDADAIARGSVHIISVHSAPVTAIAYHPRSHLCLSTDVKGHIEYWSTDADKGFQPPQGTTKFSFKSETDLFDAAKRKACVYTIAISRDGTKFVTTSSDKTVRVFQTKSGKLLRSYDEGLEVYEALQADGKLGIDTLEFGKRMAMEKEYQQAGLQTARELGYVPVDDGKSLKISTRTDAQARAPFANALFDESGNFIMYSTMLGVKIVNIVTNRVSTLLGKVESSERFGAISLYQGIPKIPASFGLVKPAFTANVGSRPGDEPQPDPTFVTTAFRRNRFYLFTRREPADFYEAAGGGAAEGRDVFNEPPSKEDLAVAAETSSALARAKLGTEAVIHTTQGDVFIKLLGDVAPKAVENFSTHSRNGYYNNLIFHRVIKGFMIQGGDPTGTGTGGESVWGYEFEDEISKSVRFDRPFLLAMANAGPNSNGSQFFITTAPCTWLDGKHTIFGRVTSGMDVVKAIEAVATDKDDRPFEDVKIVNVDIK